MRAQQGNTGLPDEAQPRRLVRRALETLVLLGVLVAVVALAPGLGEARKLLADASPGWLAVAVLLEALSCWSYVLAFRPVFCTQMSWRSTIEISWAELGMGSIVPASGAGGLALGAWILSRSGMPASQIARRSVAFFILKSGVNFVAVAVIGLLFAFGIVGPSQPLWRTLLPALLALAAIAAVAAIGALDEPEPADPDRERLARWWNATRRAIVGGVREAGGLLKARDALLLTGVFGYWAFDNFVLWATYHAVGASPPISVILIGYLIGQLGGALPIPGGVGGIDLGLVGTLIVYGASAQPTVAAVLAYRLILFWLPLLGGLPAFWSLRRWLNHPARPDLCIPAAAPATAGAENRS
ncbi:MAG TPA: lysylphosphatidylglycerol synthase transmembrane domain-containing protein [Thermoleophilaceae bacterium]